MRYKRGYACRCSNSKCRARRTLPKHPDVYIRPPKCDCGRREWAVDTDRMTRWYRESLLCTCEGYHHKHRKGSPFCIHNPMGEYRQAQRLGYEDDELLAEGVNYLISLAHP